MFILTILCLFRKPNFNVEMSSAAAVHVFILSFALQFFLYDFWHSTERWRRNVSSKLAMHLMYDDDDDDDDWYTSRVNILYRKTTQLQQCVHFSHFVVG